MNTYNIIEKWNDPLKHDLYGTQSIWGEPTLELAQAEIPALRQEGFTYWIEDDEGNTYDGETT